MLQVKDISISFGKNLILDQISFDLPKGEILAIMGESGSGKSTLLNLISGVIKASSGEILFQNKAVDSYIKAYVPQNLGLLPWKKVRDNIFLVKKINQSLGISENEADEIIRELGIEKLLDRYPAELSGGQRQRVALARLFVSQPDILLMDEPFSALDTFTAEVSRNLFLDLWKKRKTTSIITTHNLEDAIQLGRHILIISSSPGRVSKIIQNPLFEKGASRNERDFFEFRQKIRNEIAKEMNKKEAENEY